MVSERARSVDSFLAMDVLERAGERDDVVHLEVGEPDFDPPEAVFDAAVDSLRGGNTGYTVARGKPELREAIAARYERDYGVAVDPDRIVVTPGSSPGLLLALAALVDPGDEVVLTDPHYASYPKFVRFLNGVVRTVPLRASEGFRPRAGDYERAVGSETSALVVNSPANPTGAVLDGGTLGEIAAVADAADATVVSDEIYHGLSYGAAEHTMLEFTDDAFVLDGFSKRYGMTGWRLGWVVAPPGYAEALNRLAQHVLISAPNFVQDAGVAALETDESWLAEVRDTYRRRRDRLLDAVQAWGLDPGYTPEGAYYVLADVSDLPGSSVEVADLFLNEAGVAVTPGADFGERASDYVRLSYATDVVAIDEAATRVDRLLDRLG
ncbi:aminotransferase class I/II-fold pyridoxal phosphate-dependent enzyme [Halosimplex litoreum]|uniref:Aminotransferase n=1 Tax=Halosimplex litoreum TaxID=1198301 RepID=A0A7T3KV77_9EURY|nr:aminotransferase class I/II-fold pyridoxal phosphate-dependent enzyme [Halosimplex litoreum]QPV62713.1 aminotransferase class I/II-fold pyridoxal phosphate-dependent enzyme [Halosimplex litoreum]